MTKTTNPISNEPDPYKVNVIHDVRNWSDNSKIVILDGAMELYANHWITLTMNSSTETYNRGNGPSTVTIPGSEEKLTQYYHISPGSADVKPTLPFTVNKYFVWNVSESDWEQVFLSNFIVSVEGPTLVTTAVPRQEEDVHEELHCKPYHNQIPMFMEELANQ